MDTSSQPIEPVYCIRTKRLVIRCWEPKDAPLLKDAVNQSREHLRPWMPWADGEPEPLQNYIDRLRRFRGQFDLGQDFIYGIFNLDENQVMGGCGLHTRLGEGAREIGYWIHKDFIGQGLATEVTSALVRVAFEILKMTRIEIHCDPQNVRSAAVPKKLGFKLEAVLKKQLKLSNDKWRDTMIWSIFAEDHPTNPSSKVEMEAFDVMGRQFI